MDPAKVLLDGADVLRGVLAPAGFEFVGTGKGQGSGGHFASGEFRRKDRRLELHVRHSLGLVRYHVGLSSIAHEDFTRAAKAVKGVLGVPQYPGFSTDPIEAFRHLRADLVGFAQVFLKGTDSEFFALVEWAGANPKPTGPL